MTELPVRPLVAFLRAVAILALDARHQLAWLGSLGLPGEPALADELALEFDAGYRLLPQFISNGWLQADVRELLDAIDAALATMSEKENRDVWAVEALATDQRWEDVRGLARSVLTSLQ
ncbi:hypothetical protein [Actinokineospora diospyrosa]|uniref:CdiI immunity protein domain-containing protein n=1 Tax=Actinokineospora diospyrosa TaxID=103728 RepID=A0ABT1IM42_9PSEU|nr:hypothetical protein [Actinokineospora diospyrosa]MCP2273716.1 hypothetical protein [Actinokineospora diospyrosa]